MDNKLMRDGWMDNKLMKGGWMIWRCWLDLKKKGSMQAPWLLCLNWL